MGQGSRPRSVLMKPRTGLHSWSMSCTCRASRYTRNMNPSRRSFLAASAGALAASRAAMPAITDDPNDFKLGVATYSLRKFQRAQAIAMLKQMNVRYINIKEFHLPVDSTPEEIKAARKEFEDAGFIIEGGGNVSFSKDDEQDIRHKF